MLIFAVKGYRRSNGKEQIRIKMRSKLKRTMGTVAVILMLWACGNGCEQEIQGVVREVSVEGLTVVTSKGDLFRVSMGKADREREDRIRPGDTVRVYYREKPDGKNVRAEKVAAKPGCRAGEAKEGREEVEGNLPDTERQRNGWYMEQEDGSLGRQIATPRDFAALRLDSFASPEGKVVYAITGCLKESKKAVWADATEAAIGKYMAFVFEGKSIVRPSPNLRLESGNFSICPSGQNATDMRRMFRMLREEMKAGDEEESLQGETAG